MAENTRGREGLKGGATVDWNWGRNGKTALIHYNPSMSDF